MNKYYKYAAILAVVLTAGCAMPQRSITSLDEVSSNQVVYYGRVQLSPHIKKEEVVYKNVINITGEELHKGLQLKASDVFYDLEAHHASDYAGSLMAVDGDYYYYAWEKDKPFIILGVSFVTLWTSTNRETMTLRVTDGIKAKHSGKSRAVYVGDITFVRDEFFNIKDIKIDQSGYQAATNAFKKKFRNQWRTEKAVLSSAR